MSDRGPPESVQTVKKKRRVKKKTAPAAQSAAAPVGPVNRPDKRAPLTVNDREIYDYVREATSKNVWYYRDRLSVPRGPCNISVLRECWVHGVIDDGTLVWGQGLIDWLPVKNVRTLVPQIRTLEVQAATWIKRQFGLKPAINRLRRERAAQRPLLTNQVADMY